MFKKFLLLCVCILVVASAAIFYVKSELDSYLSQTVRIQEPTLVTIKSGTSVGSLLNRFEQQQWIDSSISKNGCLD